MAEPTPIRDNGPYVDERAALAQLDAVTYGLPADAVTPTTGPALVILEALTLTGVKFTDYERAAVDELASAVSPATAQVVAGWVMRAYVARRA